MQPITITPQQPGCYKCGHCALHFRTKALFNSHVSVCMSIKQIRARATFTKDSVPHMNHDELISLVQMLAVRLEKNEHEIKTLKCQVRQLQSKSNQCEDSITRATLVDWLNANKSPTVSLFDWNITINSHHLSLVFEHGFIEGICKIIHSTMNETKTPPFNAYVEAPNSFFVYVPNTSDGTPIKNVTNNWRLMTHIEFEKMINSTQKQLMTEFISWQEQHSQQLLHPEFIEIYNANLLKVTGSGKAKSGGCSNRDLLITRLKTKLYDTVKSSANEEHLQQIHK